MKIKYIGGLGRIHRFIHKGTEYTFEAGKDIDIPDEAYESIQKNYKLRSFITNIESVDISKLVLQHETKIVDLQKQVDVLKSKVVV